MHVIKKARAARYLQTGEPVSVVQVDEVEVSAPGAGEVQVQMEYSPINPADLNMIEGKYGEVRPLPDVPGNEGCGRIVAVGEGVDRSWLGRHVLVDSEAWREAGNWTVDSLVPVPQGLDPRLASVLRVNPPTAWRMLHDFVDLRPGHWVVQNAATSAVGRAVGEIARHNGWRILNLVRRPESIEDLRAAGAEAVILDGPDAAAEAAEVLGKERPKLGLNAVGGASATRVAGLLEPGGVIVTYGAMSKEALKIPNGFLIFRDLSFRGFWLTRWLREASATERAAMYDEIFRLAAAGCFTPRVGMEKNLSEVRDALLQVSLARGGGKVMLRLQE